MPDNNARNPYPILNRMTTEELDALLAQMFLAPDEEELDTDYIAAILEVMKQREAADTPQVDVDAAWQEFQERYQEACCSSDAGDLPESDSSHLDQIPDYTPESAPGARKRFRALRIIAVLAALVAVLCGLSSAFGLDFLRFFGFWKADDFRYTSAAELTDPSAQDANPFASLRVMVANYTDTPAVPYWSPDGTEVNGEVSIVEHMDGVRIFEQFSYNHKTFSIAVRIYNEEPENYYSTYPGEEKSMEQYTFNGIVYHIIRNYDKYSITWLNGNIEGLIQGDLEVEDLKIMVDSIYK